MKHVLTTYINNEKINIGTTPLSFFSPESCDMAIKVAIPREEKTISIKLYFLIAAGGGNGGSGASYHFGCSLEEPCDEIITIQSWRYSTQLKTILIEPNYKTESTTSLNEFCYVSSTIGGGSLSSGSKPTYVKIYCGSRLVETLGSYGSSKNLSEIGTYSWYNGVFQTGSKIEPTAISFKSYSDSVLVIPFVKDKPKTNNLEDKYKYHPCIYVGGKKYYYGKRMPSLEEIKNIYMRGIPEEIKEETIIKQMEDNPETIPISQRLITGSELQYPSSGKAVKYLYYSDSNGKVTVKNCVVNHDPSNMNISHTEVMYTDPDTGHKYYGVVVYDKITGEMIDSSSTDGATINYLGDGTVILNVNGKGAINSPDIGGSTYIGSIGTGTGGQSASWYRYIQNMGNGYHKMLGQDGNYYVYDASKGTYTPM